MSNIPGRSPPDDPAATGAQSIGTDAQPNGPAQYEIWFSLLSQLVATGTDVGRLFTLELQLALGDARRMFFLLLLAVPFVLLAWVSFCALLSWLVIDYSQSIGLGLATFFILQLAMIRYMQALWRRYSSSLTLPTTRQHLQSLLDITRTGDLRHNEPHPPEP